MTQGLRNVGSIKNYWYTFCVHIKKKNMKIPNVVLASMVSASFFVSCKNNTVVKNKTKAEIEKIKQDSIKKVNAEMDKKINGCRACGMG